MESNALEITVLNATPKGGQQVGITNRAVKVLHKPTGIYAVCDNEHSQHKNLRIAKAMVEYGLAEIGWKEIG